MAASDEEDIKPTKTKKRKVETDMKLPKLAILFDVRTSKFTILLNALWMQVHCGAFTCSNIYMNAGKVRWVFSLLHIYEGHKKHLRLIW